MSNKSTKTTEPKFKNPVDELKEHEIALAETNKVLDKRFGFSEVYDFATYRHELQSQILLHGKTIFRIGYILIKIKENEPHGKFKETLKEIGIQYRTAHNYMKATLKLGSVKSENVSLLNASKIYELMLLDDEDIKELDEGGSVAGIKLDEVDKMTTSELRAKLRDRDTDIEVSRERVAELSSKLEIEKTKNSKYEKAGITSMSSKISDFDLEVSKAAYQLTLASNSFEQLYPAVKELVVDGTNGLNQMDKKNIQLNLIDNLRREYARITNIYQVFEESLGGIGKVRTEQEIEERQAKYDEMMEKHRASMANSDNQN